MSDIKSVCGLWIRPTKKDPNKKYLSGLDLRALQGLDPDKWRIMIFKNDKKEGEKDPDYRVLAFPNDPNYQKKSTYKPQPKKEYAPQAPSSNNDDDGLGF